MGATLCKNGTCSTEIHTRIASAMAAMARLSRTWRSHAINSQTSSSCSSLFSPPSSFVALKHGLCLLILKERSRLSKPEETSPHLLRGAQVQRLSAEQDQLPCRYTGTSSGSCLVRTCHTPGQSLQNHPSGHLGRWATPWSAEEMLDGQQQRVDNPAHARTAHSDLLQKKQNKKNTEKRLEEYLC